jgi:uncharacterized protein (DUF952 family)
MKLFHITTRAAWDGARLAGVYTPPSLESQGFIHLSVERQWPGVRERFYAGVIDLVLLVIDPERLSGEVRFEAADGDTFPHLYASLNLDAVDAVHALPDPGG